MHLFLVPIVTHISIFFYRDYYYLFLGPPQSQDQSKTEALRIDSQHFGRLTSLEASDHTAAESFFYRAQHDGLSGNALIPHLILSQRQIAADHDISRWPFSLL